MFLKKSRSLAFGLVVLLMLLGNVGKVNAEILEKKESKNSEELIAFEDVNKNHIEINGISSRFNGISVTKWFDIPPKLFNWSIPNVEKIWHVVYINGRKYSGYMYWTGRYQLLVAGGNWPTYYYEFKGQLS
ncbi:MAG: hypothetical protein LBV67_06905 [Streptococcaceae bacterium]|jgi:hypothetical protein|nr:hypothetical protein [Streptococcaceae bacterium]